MKAMSQQIGAELVSFNKGHYYVSGFIKREEKYVYFSISDVRHFPGSWVNDVLVRTAKHEKDYTGGANNRTELWDCDDKIHYLLTR